MEITKDGSVFRIALGSGVSAGPETRISFAVNSHYEMRRPRIEVSGNGLRELFMRMVPYISGASLVSGDYDLSYERRVVDGLARVLGEVLGEDRFLQGFPRENREQLQKLRENMLSLLGLQSN